jgi:hypothetical protein
MIVSNTRVAIEERPDADADAHVSGTQAAWVAAFSPDRDRGGLEFSGDRALADRLLDGLAAVPHERRRTAAA